MPAARRAYWTGYLKLSLVTYPIALYPASSQAEKTHFHQINRKTGNRLHSRWSMKRPLRVVEKDNKGRGYEVAKGKYVEIEPEGIKAIQVESTHTLDIEKFVPIDEIDRRYFDRPLLHRS
jgi:Ku protein